MADYDSSLPVRSESDGDDERLHAKLVDGTTSPAVNQAAVDSDNNLKVEVNGDNPAGTDVTMRLSELGAPNPDGDYDGTNNSKPANIGLIVHDRVTTPADANQNFRVTGKQSTDDDTIHAMDVSMMDSDGDPITPTNPFNVVLDGDYDVTNNPDPSSIGLIAHDRNATPGEAQQNTRLTGVQGTDDNTVHALDVALHDADGDAYTNTNPLPVVMNLTGAGGDPIFDFKQASSVAKDTSDDHDYTVTGEKLLRSGHGYLWWVPIDKQAREMGIPEGTFVATGFGTQRIMVIPRWNTVIVHQVNVIDCIVTVMQKHETSFKNAIIRLYLCRYPFFALREECRECGFVGNFVNSGFIGILSKIIDARLSENL